MSNWLRKIQALGACADAIEWAKGYDTYPAMIAACERLDWLEWLLSHFSPAWAEYERVTAPALAEYERVTAPALAEYDRVRAPAARAACLTIKEML